MSLQMPTPGDTLSMYEQTLVLIHLTILLDIEAEKALDRKEGDLDRMEQLDLLRSARAAYISLSTRHAHRIKVIQAEEPVHDIYSKIVHMVKKIIGP